MRRHGWPLMVMACVFAGQARAQSVPNAGTDRIALEQEIAVLRERVRQLEGRLAQVEARFQGPVQAKHDKKDKEPQLVVGQVIVVGNEKTPMEVILRQLPASLTPGQKFKEADLKLAEQRLQRLNLFEVNPQTGVHPTVTVLDSNPNLPIKDILVHVHER